MASNPPGDCCTKGFRFEGEPTGKAIKVGQHDAYLAIPNASNAKDAAILIVPDVISIWQNSMLIADQFAERGYLTLIIDPFAGDALSLNRPSGFDFVHWLTKGSSGDNPHTKEAVDPIIEAAIKYLKEQHNVKKLGGVGYCFGAKYVARHFKNGIEVGFLAHPSFVEEEELEGFKAPLSIAAAETDSIFPAEKRHKSEEILAKNGQPYQINLYSQVVHGFSVRCDTSKKIERFAKEQAFEQAVTWFDTWLI
ncbi:dienelactone hydrolase [Annulohypoxylon maeteangense]|uniref:dienelactone hydrolase n=1 Tax=Annulohypoxylon maeteangense TaxID=1927788 RepID=UPI002008658D|nr:dienelactone hydrolase [Annulohypoxylon maeteangense]KAI0887701.1 dienelactone hydrolase [Annulohypoxylon maeteangense]